MRTGASSSVKTLVIALALALGGLSAASSASAAGVAILAGNNDTKGTINMLVVVPPGSEVGLFEDLGSRREPVRTVASTQVIDDLLPATCDRRTRRFVATAPGHPDARTEVLTPSCRKRMELQAPERVAIGAAAELAVIDRFGIGGIAPTLCLTEPAAPASRACAPLPVAPGEREAAMTRTLSKRGYWKVELSTPWQTIERNLAVGVASPAPVAADPAVVFYGDSIMSQLVVPVEDRLPAEVSTERHIEGGSGLTFDEEHRWLERADERTRALDPAVSVVLFGGADGRAFRVNGTSYPFGSSTWPYIYYSKVHAMMSNLLGGDGRVVWVLNPVPAAPDKRDVINTIEPIIRFAAQQFPPGKVSLVDLRETLSPGGVYSPTVVRGGETVTVRAEDGLHLSLPGAEIAADQTYAAIGALPPGPVPPDSNKRPVCTALGGDFVIGNGRVAGTCSDPDGDTLHLTLADPGPGKGTLAITGQDTASPQVAYTAGAAGTDGFAFSASDGRESAGATVTTQNGTAGSNTAPVCTALDGSPMVGEERSAGSCLDPDGDPVDVTVVEQPSRGTVAIADDGTPSPKLRYAAREAGADTFVVTASDGAASSEPITVRMDNRAKPNAAPRCGPAVVALGLGSAREFTCTDADGDPLAYVIDDPPALGTAADVGGRLRYSASRPGVDTLAFHARDDAVSSPSVTLTFFNIAPSPRGPAPAALGPLPAFPGALGVACAGLKGKRLAACKLDRKVQRTCGRLRGRKRTVCARRVRALARCAAMRPRSKRARARKRACVRRAKAIGRPVKKS